MFSTGEVCIVSPTPITSIDPDAAALAELDLGSNLLDLDLVQEQQRHRMGDAPGPSIFNFGFPPAPEMQGLSFYQDQHPAPQPMMGAPMFQQGGFGNVLSEIDESEMARLLMREMIPDIVADCQMLNIHPNLYTWSPEDVQRWIECVTRRYELGDVNPILFHMSGAALASMRDEEFRERVPKCGDILFSIVYILKSAAGVNIDQHQVQVVPQAPFVPNVPAPVVPTTQTVVPPAYDTHHQMMPAPVSPNAMHKDYDSGSTGSPSDDEVSIPSPAPSGPNTSMTPNHTGGIQLWQFLKELLLQPNSYSYCIRWLDRSQGIFKIEDSVEVARLWGLRKNRPAMNYDKLSRSIRQYYRKGIMKKTEVSQRLVYQFVHPC